MRKIFILSLAIVMVFSSFPLRGEGVNFVRDIDVEFVDLALRFNGKSIAGQKELFLYGENLYVSLGDLAKGLDIGINISGDNIFLNSRGRLIDNLTKKSISFQRGYEILTKERIIDALEEEVRLLEGKNVKSPTNKVTLPLRNIRVGLGGINVVLDGKRINLGLSPLKYNRDYYLALDDIAPYLYITPSISKDGSTIGIDGNGVLINPSNLNYLVSMREGKNYLLDLQRQELENRRHILKDLRLPFKKIDSVKSLESYLNTYFSTIGEIETSISLSQQSNWINLDISFPTSKNNQWVKLRRSDVENWIWNIYTSILNLYDDNALISGVIRNPYYNTQRYYSSSYRDYVYFNTRDKDIYFDFTSSRLLVDSNINPDYLVEVLNDKFAKHYNIEFSYSAEMLGDDIELVVYPYNDKFDRLSLYVKMGYFKTLNQRIRDIYPDVRIIGKLVSPSADLPIIDFVIEDNMVGSRDLLNATEEQINNSYGRAHGFKLNYSLLELDMKNFHLIVEGDFSVDDDRWFEAGEEGRQALNTVVHNALSTIISLWDANVTVDIVDKNGAEIFDYDFYQDKVSVVFANPTSGTVTEGSLIELWTNTPDATIYYTLDGSSPTSSSLIYEDGIAIYHDTTINAFGYSSGLGAGEISSFTYVVEKDPNLSQGLDDLLVEDENSNVLELEPSFEKGILDYNLNVNPNISKLYVTPSGNGDIRINGSPYADSPFEVSIGDNATTISISVKEEDKNEKIYTIHVEKDTGLPSFNVKSIVFSTSLRVFSGTVTSNIVTDFSGYKVRLLTRSGVEKGETNLNPNGSFVMSEFDVDFFDMVIGFKYQIYDGNGRPVIGGNLQ
ncbi:MAG: FN3 associated domain-containing protein [Tissierellaceae bacterium]